MINGHPETRNAPIRLFGWKATIFYGDPLVFDRWIWLRRHLRPGSLRTLDAGCGSGAFTLYAAKIGNEARGLSFDERNNRKATVRADILGIPNATFLQADLRQLDRLKDQLGRFDQIICFETIEHIRDDRKLVRDLSDLLTRSGRLLLTTPFSGCPPLRGDTVSEREDGGHVRWGYTHEEIRRLFEAHGLEVTAEEYISGTVSQHIVNLQRAISVVSPLLGWTATFPLRICQVVDPTVTNILKRPWLSIGVVGLKRTTR